MRWKAYKSPEQRQQRSASFKMISMCGKHCLCSACAYREYGNDFGAEYSNGTRLLAMWMSRIATTKFSPKNSWRVLWYTHSLLLFHSFYRVCTIVHFVAVAGVCHESHHMFRTLYNTNDTQNTHAQLHDYRFERLTLCVVQTHTCSRFSFALYSDVVRCLYLFWCWHYSPTSVHTICFTPNQPIQTHVHRPDTSNAHRC